MARKPKHLMRPAYDAPAAAVLLCLCACALSLASAWAIGSAPAAMAVSDDLPIDAVTAAAPAAWHPEPATRHYEAGPAEPYVITTEPEDDITAPDDTPIATAAEEPDEVPDDAANGPEAAGPDAPVQEESPEPDAAPAFEPTDLIPLSRDLQAVLAKAVTDKNIDYIVALGLIDVESDFDPYALNEDTGCYGLCQINPDYWPADLDPAGNIRQGMHILRYNLDRYHQDIYAALTGYNAGHDTGGRSYAKEVLDEAAKWAGILGVEWTRP